MQPMSLMEWFVDFYRPALKAGRTRGRDGAPSAGRLYQTICKAGETIFVPRGWWHTVLNLGEMRITGSDGDGSPAVEYGRPDVLTIAVTENFCTAAALPHVLRFLRDQKASISGINPPERADRFYDEVTAALAVHAPQELAKALECMRDEDAVKEGGADNKKAPAPSERESEQPNKRAKRIGWSSIVPAAAATADASASNGSVTSVASAGTSSHQPSSSSFSFGFDALL